MGGGTTHASEGLTVLHNKKTYSNKASFPIAAVNPVELYWFDTLMLVGVASLL